MSDELFASRRRSSVLMMMVMVMMVLVMMVMDMMVNMIDRSIHQRSSPTTPSLLTGY